MRRTAVEKVEFWDGGIDKLVVQDGRAVISRSGQPILNFTTKDADTIMEFIRLGREELLAQAKRAEEQADSEDSA